MPNLTSMNRTAFVNFLGCILARWYWAESEQNLDDLLSDLSNSYFSEMEIGPLKKSILPISPTAVFGDDVWAAVNKHVRKTIRANKNKRSVMVNYRTASFVAQSMKVVSLRDWTKFTTDNSSPWDLPLPKSPSKRYLNEWTDWPTFLGQTKRPPFLTYDEARSLVYKLEVTTVKDFREYIGSGLADDRMPKRPDHVYADVWNGWASFLPSRFYSYDEAREMLSEFSLRSEGDFRELGATGARPEGIPSHPATYYSEEWVSWAHFLSRESSSKNSKKTA